MMKLHRLNNLCLAALSCAALLQGCIKNDIPYPQTQQNITSISAEGEASAAKIDEVNLTATLYLAEDVDIKNVKFSRFEVTEGAEASKNLLEGTYDLSLPISVTLSQYRSYQWIIEAEQTIDRYLSISGQIGETLIDVPGKRVVVTVPDNLSVRRLQLQSIKLGPANVTTMVPEMTPGSYDFSSPVKVRVSYFDKSEEWTIFVIVSDTVVETTEVDAWSQVIWAYGSAVEGADNGFEYRETDETEWHKVADTLVSHNGGSFSCYIPHLKSGTKYVVRATSDDNVANEVEVTTDDIQSLPNASFDNWWYKNNKIWCPWDENGTQFWDTGNTGATTLGSSNVVPSDYTPFNRGMSAKLETKFVGIASIGKLAAGSIYSGNFEKVDGTNGILAFGRPWTTRPTKLKGYYQYTTATIDYASTEYKSLIGQPDTCHIYIALLDWDAPYQIRTNPNNRQLFDKNSSAVIAYGDLQCATSMSGWQEFEITLNYRSTSRRPKYILVAAAASKLGDFFTGGTGACLYVDDFSLSYDY
jgi:hypothetical protein